MEKNKKRAKRRHHVARLKKKYKAVAKRWAGDKSANQMTWKRVKLGPGGLVRVLDKDSDKKRNARIDRNLRLLVSTHGRPCSCYLCKRERYNRRKDKLS